MKLGALSHICILHRYRAQLHIDAELLWQYTSCHIFCR